MEYMSDIINGLILLGVALIEARATLYRRRDKEDRLRAERRAAQRAGESLMAMGMMDSTLELCVATALAVERGSTNGEMSAAKKSAAAAREEYDNFVKSIASQQIAKI